MDLQNFENWLRSIKNKKGNPYSEKAIATRIKNLKTVENILVNVDECIRTDRSMYNALITLKQIDVPEHQYLQTSLRRYWEFKHGLEFPRLNIYEEKHGIRITE